MRLHKVKHCTSTLVGDVEDKVNKQLRLLNTWERAEVLKLRKFDNVYIQTVNIYWEES